MPTTEETQYSMICKEKFETLIENDKVIFQKVDEMHKVIVGDGESNGIKGRLIRVEEQVTVQKRRWGYILGILAVVLAAAIIAAGGAILKGLQ